MAGLWQRTGNVTVTNGSKTITGFGTKWKTGTLPIQKGHTFYGPDNAAYEVDTVVSDESILLVDTYRGGTLANQAYRIDITRTSTISQFAADLASLVAKYRSWFDGMMTWLTGSGDVAILNPDTGANVTIPSWKKVASEGEGQAARAKTEADKAAASAALAGDIVVASALPLPDVWAPLSDSLRLITGYGRDVLVGSDVVARMVDFSRSTTKNYQGKDGLQKTVAINEAAFGSGGCLVDGQSTNIIPWSADLSRWVRYAASVLEMQPNGYTKITPTGLSSGCYISTPTLVVGNAYTISFWGYAENDISSVVIGTEKEGKYVTELTTKPTRITLSFIAKQTNGTMVCYGGRNNSNDPFYVKDFQLEALPFATSHIPTNGAAVTRAADAIQIPYAGNGVPLSDMQMTMSAIIKTILRPGEPTALIDALDIEPSVGVFLYDTGYITARIFGINWNSGFIPDMTKEQVVALSFNGATGAVAMRVGNKVVTGTVVVPNGISRSAGNIGLLCRSNTDTRTGFGSVRDFKIWHKFFTVEQLKAIK